MRLFGLRVAELRRERALTQEQLAERAGLSYRWMQRIEAGDANISLAKVAELAHALGHELGELFTPPRATIRKPGRPAKR